MLEWTIWNILNLDLSRFRSVISLWTSWPAHSRDGQKLPRQVLATSAGAQRTAVGLPILWSRCWARTLRGTWDGRYCGTYHWVKVCEHLKNLQHGGNLHFWCEHMLEVLEKWWFLRFDPANSQALWDLEALEALIARVQVPWQKMERSQIPGPFRWQYMNNVNPGLINPVYGCLIGRVPFKYQIMTIGGVPPQLINHGLLIRSWHYMTIWRLDVSRIFQGLSEDDHFGGTHMIPRVPAWTMGIWGSETTLLVAPWTSAQLIHTW